MAFSIEANKRTPGGAAQVRAADSVPGVVYGGGRSESLSLSVGYNVLDKLYNEAGESSLIDLSLPGEAPVKVLIQDLQFDPVSGRITHVDFRQINMTEEMTAAIELTFIGEAPAVKGLGGTLMKTINYVNVRCLPKDLVGEIAVDLGRLATFDDVIHVSDLNVPTGITVTDSLDLVLAKVSPPLSEDEIKAMDEAGSVDISTIEVEKKGKKEEAGEAAEAGEAQK
ncbi:MAG: 50S ribosomal protein L25 [Candidatus Magasanikbacteria bacterium GW2011_GWA2_56_11]|uniref:Large ribosomal subunit protein bL25 n=1 Tax=Candidatus Magasanikbacteria bacterium GW2011_GWA2_56_11 TaxID=1619044 RepID=A0A0G1YI61_9BACT|nr:MAG: 50S ribosomal protein L25 [Candidatus Magasanikbacteria bacterium GW2011_GWA2_56_11]